MLSDLILILGGARSGKSSYAETLAAEMGRHVLYVATAEAKDDDMTARIAAHRLSRPDHWQTLEAPIQVGAALSQVDTRPDVILLDCMTLLVSNILLAHEAEPEAVIESAVQTEIKALMSAQTQLNAPLLIVSNEVGLGLVPPYSLGRVYRDILGRANQRLAAEAKKVIFMVAGLPMTLKEER